MRFLVALLLLCCGCSASAQADLPFFGKQVAHNGYVKDIEGEVLPYFSVYPEYATTALLTRCTDGKKAIAWETAPVESRVEPGYYYFSWIAAHNSTTSKGDRSFDLYINDRLALTFTTHHSTTPGSWSAGGADSTRLVFEFVKMDRHGDAHGFAHLRVPAERILAGKPQRIKIVGHAQDSPDWFMTFRYTFKEKVELEALPFLTKSGQQPIQFTVMHFGGPTNLEVTVNNAKPARVAPITRGLNVFEVEAPPSPKEQRVHVNVTWKGWGRLDTNITVMPVVHRDVYLVHHSHNDIGYSHLQTEVERIQNNNIYKALDLIDHTRDYPVDSRFVWNIESLWAVENFFHVARKTDKLRFVSAVKNKSIALSANYANILTGLCTPEEMHWIVEYADSLRKWFNLPITSAMQTDIPGMSWSMVDAYAAHGIRYLSQGPNYIPGLPDGGDRIGSTLREQGDKPYWWKGTTGRDSILVWTAGLGYGGWHGFTAGAIKERGTRKIAAYMNDLAANGYPYDMVQWRYNIVSDNGPVDSTISDFVRDWNEKYASPHLILANVGDMMAEFEKKYGKSIPTWSGDFTPYWEDGAYSTAKEEGDVRVLSARLSALIKTAKRLGKPIDPHQLYRAKRSIVMWHEHTWGAWNSVDEPDNPDVIAQWNYKKAFVDSAAWYVATIEEALHLAYAMREDTTKVVQLPWVSRDEWQVCSMQSADGGRADSALINVFRSIAYVNAIPQDWSGEYGEFNELPWRRACGVSFGNPLPPEKLCRSIYRVGDMQRDIDVMNPDSDSDVYRYPIDAYCGVLHIRDVVEKRSILRKESLHLAFPFNIPNATVRIGISDTCVTPETGRIPGSNNDYFCAQRWIDVSNDSMGVTIVCPQGALWEVGDMIDERKVEPGLGTNAEKYKHWKSEAKSSSTIYLYALNNYWHTNFKADQEGPITFDIYLKMHGPFKLEDARRFGLEMTRPLITWWK